MSGIPQESAFFKANVFNKAGGVDNRLQYAMDFDLWWRLSKVTKIRYLPTINGNYRDHINTKGNITESMVDSPFRREIIAVKKKYLKRPMLPGEERILFMVHTIIRRVTKFFQKYLVSKTQDHQ